jgi:hypothetical protein
MVIVILFLLPRPNGSPRTLIFFPFSLFFPLCLPVLFLISCLDRVASPFEIPLRYRTPWGPGLCTFAKFTLLHFIYPDIASFPTHPPSPRPPQTTRHQAYPQA